MAQNLVIGEYWYSWSLIFWAIDESSIHILSLCLAKRWRPAAVHLLGMSIDFLALLKTS